MTTHIAMTMTATIVSYMTKNSNHCQLHDQGQQADIISDFENRPHAVAGSSAPAVRHKRVIFRRNRAE